MLHTRNDWYVACSESELADAAPLATTVLDERIVVWRSAGAIVAMEDRCVHRAAPLSLGRCEGARLRCMYHGLEFDAAGAVVRIPGQDLIPPSARVKTYPVATRYGWVWLWMGDAAKADPSLIHGLPEGVALDDFLMDGGALDYASEARLISDNLLDFSHLSYVHANSFEPGGLWAEKPMKISMLPRGVRFERWVENSTGPGFLKLTARVDEWLGYDYLIPGVLIMWSGSFPLGTAKAAGFARPDFSRAIGQAALNVQAVTPKTSRTSRYYFLTGPHRDFGDERARDGMVAINKMAFAEDKVMIEAQQQVLDRAPDRSLMPIVHDRGVTLYNRLLERLVAEESEELTAAAAAVA